MSTPAPAADQLQNLQLGAYTARRDDAGELWTVLSRRAGGGGADGALDPAGPARAADGQHPLQRIAAQRAADVLVPAQQAPAGDGALRPDHAGAAPRRARPRLPADAGGGGA